MVGGGNPCFLGVAWGHEEGLLHPERFEDAIPEKAVKRTSGCNLHDTAECVERCQSAVGIARSRLKIERCFSPKRNIFAQTFPRTGDASQGPDLLTACSAGTE